MVLPPLRMLSTLLENNSDPAEKEQPFLNVTIISRRNETSSGDLEHPIQWRINFVGYFLMSAFLIILSIILGILVITILRRRHRYESSGSSTNRSSTPSRSMMLRIQRRYETIEHWIITKQVQAHDAFCDKVVTNFGHHDDDDSKPQPQETNRCPSFLLDNDTTTIADQRECPICMSNLSQGQIVSWSANDACSHVYHHQCIKEWLLRHTECCLCKNIFLPVDEKKGRAKEAALQDLSCRYAAASATSYYCAKTGLVRIPRSVRCTKAELNQLERRIFGGTVVPAKLAAIRGSREATSSRNDDMLPIVSANHSALATTSAASTSFTNASDTTDSVEEEPTQDSTRQAESTAQHRSSCSKDVELGDQELLTASYHLELEKSRIGDNRCCIDDTDDSVVEVKETCSSGHISEEEESTSDTNADSNS